MYLEKKFLIYYLTYRKLKKIELKKMLIYT